MAEEHHRSGQSKPASIRGHVLVAEDDPVSQFYIAELLTYFGCSSDLVSNGEDAMDAVEQGHYDFVLMDCQMPELDGFTAAREIRKREAAGRIPGRVPIVAVTANSLDGDRERCFEAGMDEYICKPVEPDSMRFLLERLLAQPPVPRRDRT